MFKHTNSTMKPAGFVAQIILGTAIGTLAITGFVTWASIAPVAGAVVATGRIIPDGRNLLVEHQMGGTVAEILVSEGEVVAAGQPIIQLDSTVLTTEFREGLTTFLAEAAKHQRLLAEATNADVISAPVALEYGKSQDFDHLFSAELDLFYAQQDNHLVKRDKMAVQIGQIHDEIIGLKTERTSVQKQLEILTSELQELRPALAKGLVSRPRVIDLEFRAVDLEGRLANITAQVAQARGRVSELEISLIVDQSQQQTTARQGLETTGRRISELKERLRGLKHALEQQTIRAPASGQVFNLMVNTRGAVVHPGEQIAEIIPSNRQLIVSADIRPIDVDDVFVGQSAQVRFSAFNMRRTPLATGHVERVSIDRIEDQDTGHYEIWVRTDFSSLPQNLTDQVSVGMPMEIHLATQERTLVEYLFQPILDTVLRGMRES